MVRFPFSTQLLALDPILNLTALITYRPFGTIDELNAFGKEAVILPFPDGRLADLEIHGDLSTGEIACAFRFPGTRFNRLWYRCLFQCFIDDRRQDFPEVRMVKDGQSQFGCMIFQVVIAPGIPLSSVEESLARKGAGLKYFYLT